MLRTTRFASVFCALGFAITPLFAQEDEQNTTSEEASAAESVDSTPVAGGALCVKTLPSVQAPANGVVGNELVARRDQLILENQVRDEDLRHEMAPSSVELQRLKLANELARARAEHAFQDKRVAIDQARLEADEIAAKTALETAKLQEKAQTEIANLRAARDRANLEAEVAQAKLQQQTSTFRTQEVTWNARLAEMNSRIAEHERGSLADNYADEKPSYVKEPLQANGALLISDRRIPLNGIITMETAEYVCTRIDYFNNKSKEYPIFIVIDDSPGGSVMAGYKILKTMQSSNAPVYVVVKSFAASMAAAICTLAPHSYAYPNAIILHHQISNGSRGNLTSQRESVKMLEEWWKRLAGPIAAKMGITAEEFAQRMYAHSASGDWQEFADEAQKLKWVDTVVGSCRETALLKSPNVGQSGNYSTATTGDDDQGRVGAEPAGGRAALATLPRLNPIDCYYLYNPDGYYHRAE